jgi:hypothetical protein
MKTSMNFGDRPSPRRRHSSASVSGLPHKPPAVWRRHEDLPPLLAFSMVCGFSHRVSALSR